MSRPRRKRADARKMAADKIEANGYHQTIVSGVLELFAYRRSWTPDAASKKLGLNPMDVRPVFSQLLAPRVDQHGNVTRPAFLIKTDKLGTSSRGNEQHYYTMRPAQVDMSELW